MQRIVFALTLSAAVGVPHYVVLADGSVDFNATTSKAEHTTANIRNGSNAVTLCAWLRAEGIGKGNFGRALGIPENNVSDVGIRHSSSANSLQLLARWSGGPVVWTFSATDNAWHAVAAAYDFSSTDNEPTVRLDFSDVSLADASPSGTLAPGTGYTIGNYGPQTVTWDGQIAYAQIFNRVLSSDEMDQALRSPGSVTDGLRLYVRLNDASDTDDRSGNGFTAAGTDLATDGMVPVVFLSNKMHHQRGQQ